LPEALTIDKKVFYDEKISCVAMGPGLGKSHETENLLKEMLNKEITLVVDADGLNILSQNMDWLKTKKAQTIFTPHPKEMSRLTGVTVVNIAKDPVTLAREYAMKWQSVVILKGARTVIATPE
jgi:NAD(P)H-hydrate epimerase